MKSWILALTWTKTNCSPNGSVNNHMNTRTLGLLALFMVFIFTMSKKHSKASQRNFSVCMLHQVYECMNRWESSVFIGWNLSFRFCLSHTPVLTLIISNMFEASQIVYGMFRLAQRCQHWIFMIPKQHWAQNESQDRLFCWLILKCDLLDFRWELDP